MHFRRKDCALDAVGNVDLPGWRGVQGGDQRALELIPPFRAVEGALETLQRRIHVVIGEATKVPHARTVDGFE